MWQRVMKPTEASERCEELKTMDSLNTYYCSSAIVCRAHACTNQPYDCLSAAAVIACLLHVMCCYYTNERVLPMCTDYNKKIENVYNTQIIWNSLTQLSCLISFIAWCSTRPPLNQTTTNRLIADLPDKLYSVTLAFLHLSQSYEMIDY